MGGKRVQFLTDFRGFGKLTTERVQSDGWADSSQIFKTWRQQHTPLGSWTFVENKSDDSSSRNSKLIMFSPVGRIRTGIHNSNTFTFFSTWLLYREKEGNKKRSLTFHHRCGSASDRKRYKILSSSIYRTKTPRIKRGEKIIRIYTGRILSI